MHVRTVAVATLIATLTLSLSACGSGNDAATRRITQVTDGVDGSITSYGNNIKVSSLLLVAQPNGSAVLVGSIVNGSGKEDALLGIAVHGAIAILSNKTLPLQQNEPLLFSGDQANASAVVPGLNAAIGTRVKVQLFFGIAGELTLDALVREKSGIYTAVGSPKI